MDRRELLAMIGGGAVVATGIGRRAARAQSAPASLPALPYPRIETTGAEALARWEALRRENKGWPVIVGDDNALALIAEQWEGSTDLVAAEREARKILAAADALTMPDLLKQRGIELGLEPPATGSWPPVPPASAGLSVASDILSGKPLARVHILLLPTKDSSEVPAWLRWGGWNDCPMPEVHVAVLRDWRRRYGTDLVGISGDVLNLRATRRPRTRDEALALAGEQYLYCPDIVDQGVGALPPLAAGLMDDDWWFFWWD